MYFIHSKDQHESQLARCKAQAYEQELHDRVRFSSRVDKDTTTVTQLSHRGITLTPCNCSALVGTATRLIRDEHYRRVAVVLAPHDSRLILSSESQNRISP